MSSGNVDFEMQNTEFRVASTDPVSAITINVVASLGGKQAILMYVAGLPSVYAVASQPGNELGPMAYRFAKGCMGLNTDGGTLWMNSNASAPSWTAQV